MNDPTGTCDVDSMIPTGCHSCGPQAQSHCSTVTTGPTSAPTKVPTSAPTKEPTSSPTDACHWDFYADGYIAGFQQPSWNTISFNSGAGGSSAVHDLTLVQCGELCDSEANCDAFDWIRGFCNLRTGDPQSDAGCDIRPDARPNGWNVYVKKCNVQEPTPAPTEACHWDFYADGYIPGFQQSSWNTISFNSGASGSSAVQDLTLVQCGQLCDSESNCDSFDWTGGLCNLRTCDPQSDTGCDIRPDARTNGWNVYVKKCNVPAPTDACHWDFFADGYILGFQQSSWNSISFNSGAAGSRAVKDLTLVQCGQLCDSEANCDSFDWTGGRCNLRTCDPRSDTGCDIRPDAR